MYEAYGGSGVRGLGVQQHTQKRNTESKIIAFLNVRPLSSEELWRNSEIHKNILFKRLKSLVERNLVIKHRYAYPFDEKHYGYLYRLNQKPVARNNRVYYILNRSAPDVKDLLDFYYALPLNGNKNEVSNTTKSMRFINKPISRKALKLMSNEELWDSVNQSVDAIIELDKMQEKIKDEKRIKLIKYFLDLAKALYKSAEEGKFKNAHEPVAERLLKVLDGSKKIPNDTKDYLRSIFPFVFHAYYFLTDAQLSKLNLYAIDKYYRDMVIRMIRHYRSTIVNSFGLVQRRERDKIYLYYRNPESFDRDEIKNIVNHFPKNNTSTWDTIIRIMTDPVMPTEKSPVWVTMAYTYSDFWDELEKGGLVGNPKF